MSILPELVSVKTEFAWKLWLWFYQLTDLMVFSKFQVHEITWRNIKWINELKLVLFKEKFHLTTFSGILNCSFTGCEVKHMTVIDNNNQKMRSALILRPKNWFAWNESAIPASNVSISVEILIIWINTNSKWMEDRRTISCMILYIKVTPAQKNIGRKTQ